MAKSELEIKLRHHMTVCGIPEWKEEYRFHDTRKWRFDFAWPEHMLAVEIEGGIYTRGRHVRVSGFEKDAEKYNEAALLGWTVLRFTASTIESGEAILALERVLK